MILTLKTGVGKKAVDQVIAKIKELGFTPSISKGAERIVVLAVNDETAFGAQMAFEEAGSAQRMITVTLGADPVGLKQLRCPGSRMCSA